MDSLLPVYLAVARLEGWYKCSACNHSFWRDLTPDAKCPRSGCDQRSPPKQETVHGTQVVSKFHCVACSHEWTRHYDLAKVCQRCHAMAHPVSPSQAVGFVYARCHECDRVSYEVQKTVGTGIQCRHCAPKATTTMRAATACSPHKRRSIDTLLQAGVLLDLMAVTRTTMYEPGTLRTRGPRVAVVTPSDQPMQNYYDILMQTPPASPSAR